MAKKAKHPFCREVTHTQYTGIKKIGDKGPQSWLQKEIIKSYGEKLGFKYVSDEFVKVPADAHIAPFAFGGTILFAIILITYFSIKDGSFGKSPDVYIYIGAWLSFVAVIIYYSTMPKKEVIFARLNGTITFPGFMWKKNITMPFDKIKFSYTSGGPNVIGAYQLVIVRPDKAGSTLQFPFGGVDCYTDLSLITWYMDKNRPLPPHTDLDPFRKKDFERRKKAKFKKPLYRSQIPTPEATPEQQAEREKIGKW